MNAFPRAAQRITLLATLALSLAAAAFALGAKLKLIHSHGSGVPYMDEWDAVGRHLLTPRGEHNLRVSDFFRPQNEHRVVLTRLIVYGLIVANGQWDPLIEMVFNAVIHAGLCAALLLFARRFVGGIRFVAVTIAMTSLFSLAFDWENTIQGFQSQFVLLEWCAAGMFWLCLSAAPMSARWLAGFGVGVLGLGTIASGFLAAPVTLGILVLSSALERRWTRRESAAAGLLVLLCVAGPLLINHVPSDDHFRARSPGQWLEAFATTLSWPDLRWPAACLVLQLPILLFAACRIRERRLAGADAALVALGVWSWLQAAAIAYGRANEGMLGSPRYSDIYSMQAAVNLIALASLWKSRPVRVAALSATLGAGWLALFAVGLRSETLANRSQFLDGLPAVQAARKRHVQAFVSTGDIAALKAAPAYELAYPSPETLAADLQDPGIRDMLSVDARPPVAITADPDTAGFSQSPAPTLPEGAGPGVWFAARGPATLVSAPLQTVDTPLLHVEFCGSGDLDASVIRLESPSARETAPRVALSPDRWRSSDLPVPEDLPLRLVVDIPPGDHWFAMTAPVEIGRGSSAVRWLLRRSDGFARGATAALAAAIGVFLLSERRRRP